jgi:AAA domain-containing protein
VTPIEKILNKLSRYRHVGHGYRAKCPGHNGNSSTSLSVGEGEDGAALIYCFGGCDHHRILSALGLDEKDLFPEGDLRRNSVRPQGGKRPPPKPPKTGEEKLILALATTHLCSLILGPVPTELPDHAMGCYVGLAEQLWDVYAEQGTHEAVQAEWVGLRPELAVSAPRLLASVDRRLRTLWGEPISKAREGGQRTPILCGKKVSTLLRKAFPPARAVVPGVILEGLQLMVGKPKLGKTRLMLDIAVAVACGGKALGTIDVEPGAVLYLSLEDSERRLQRRFLTLLAEHASPETLEYETAWPRLDEGGLEALACWIDRHPTARLIVIDPLKRIRPRGSRRRNAYDEDYEALQSLQDLVNRHPGLAIVVIHHSNKLRDVEDVADLISGSTGLPAGADGFAIMRRQRGTAEATLAIVHRDLEDDREHALKSDPRSGGWTLLGRAEDYRLSEERQAILEVVRTAQGPMSPKEIARALGREDAKGLNALYFLLHKMRHAGDIDSPKKGLYSAKVAQDAKEPKDAQDAKDAPRQEEILSDSGGTAQDSAKDAPVENHDENSCKHAILSDLSELSATSSSAALDTCPVCGSWDLSPSVSGKRICIPCLQRSEWEDPVQEDGAELEAAMAEHEVSIAAPCTGGDNPTYCLFCEAPLSEGDLTRSSRARSCARDVRPCQRYFPDLPADHERNPS